MENEQCGNCKFYDYDKGYCRRYPPSNLKYATSEAYTREFRVSSLEWCGEYQPKITKKGKSNGTTRD